MTEPVSFPVSIHFSQLIPPQSTASPDAFQYLLLERLTFPFAQGPRSRKPWS
jgi:hypothetical protein